MLWSGPVVHRVKRHQVGVFELTEGELGLGLGSVAGYHLGDRPVVAVGDQYSLTEQLVLQHGAGLVVDVEGEPVLGRGVSGEFPADDAPRPGVASDLADLGFDLGPGPAGMAAGQGVGQRGQFRGGFGQGGPYPIL